MDKILVLGSTSFGGAWFISEALERGYDVFGVSRSVEPDDIFLPYKNSGKLSNFKFQQCDINQDFDDLSTIIDTYQPNYVVDFAGQGMVAPSWDWPEQWYQTNIVAKARIHTKLRTCPSLKKYIRISTPEVYGAHDEKIDESASYNPSTPYAVSHAATDMSLTCLHRQFDFPIVFTRFANFYGEHQQLYRIVPRAAICAISDEILSLHGGGTSIRAFIHGQDVADGILKAMEEGKAGESYHFSTDEFVSIRHVVEKVAEVANIPLSDFVQISEDRPGKDQAYLMDASKARRELGWVPKHSLEDGIGTTFRWIEKNLDLILTLPQNYIHKI